MHYIAVDNKKCADIGNMNARNKTKKKINGNIIALKISFQVVTLVSVKVIKEFLR